MLATITTPQSTETINAMHEGRDSVMATALRLVIVVGCVAAVAVLIAGPSGALSGRPAAGRGLLPSGIDGAILASVLLVSAGVAMVVARGFRAVGWLTIGLGLVWVVASAAHSPGVPPFVRPIAAGAPSMVVVLLCATSVAVDEGRASRHARRMAVALVIVGAVVASMRVMSYSPFFDPACSSACVRSEPIIDLAPSAQLGLGRAAQMLGLVAGVAAIVLASLSGLWRPLGHGSRRLAQMGVLLAGAGMGGSAAFALAGQQPRATASTDGTPDAFFLLLEIAGTLVLAAGMWWSVGRLVRMRARIGRLAADIAAAPDETTVEVGLATVLHDPTIRIGYVPADGEGYVAGDGAPFDVLGRTSGESTTTIERHGRPVAVIRHRMALDAGVVRGELTAPMLVALDNERLRALALAGLRTLREARTRIVAIEDDERRRLERNLHDGAQQQILAIAFDLRLARSEAERAGNAEAQTRLARAEALALAALDDLRQVARGVHPAILDQGGLAPALSSLAEDAPIAIALRMDRSLRLAPFLEGAAYQVVAEGVADAAGAGATEIVVAVARSEALLSLDLEFDGRPPPPWPVRIADRVGAAGGDVTVNLTVANRTTLRAVMPCG